MDHDEQSNVTNFSNFSAPTKHHPRPTIPRRALRLDAGTRDDLTVDAITLGEGFRRQLRERKIRRWGDELDLKLGWLFSKTLVRSLGYFELNLIVTLRGVVLLEDQRSSGKGSSMDPTT
ncbi:uncharacterized protein LOC122050400 [Zingiber officinale]|uniref:uncharacterized protein LOC122050400 n=1 Tax=Zingiber officinale TaxID=94328 RepID=UPI001C4D88C4|nr:uncharacterized protein LOC122050400 [Zingiber officinale]